MSSVPRIPFRRGDIWTVPDSVLNLPPDAKRGPLHSSRPFLILSGDDSNQDSDWPIVLGCPISSSTGFRTKYCVKLAAGEAGATKRCWIRVVSIQPLDVNHLRERTGKLSDDKLAEVEESLFEYMGILPGI